MTAPGIVFSAIPAKCVQKLDKTATRSRILLGTCTPINLLLSIPRTISVSLAAYVSWMSDAC